MSVDNTTIKQSFTMDGATTAFTLTLNVLYAEPTGIKAVVVNATNTRTTLAYTTDYTVVPNVSGVGGIIYVTNARSATDKLWVYRDTSDLQSSDYEDYNQFPADTVELDFDRRTMRSQEMKDDLARALKFSVVTSNLTNSTLPTPVDGMCLVWSGTDGTLINSTVSADSASTLAISAATVAQGAATAASVFADNALASQYAASSSASIATASAILAISAANTALGANRTIDTLLITTNAVINIATIGTLNITTNASIAMMTATAATVGTLAITTAASANMMDMAAATAGQLLVTTMATVNAMTAGNVRITTNASIANATVTALTVTTVNLSAGTIAKEVNIAIATTGASPTFTTQADFNKLFGSAGRASGGEITSAGTDSISVAAGAGFIKATDSDTATLISFNWAAGAITVLTNTTTYVYVTYNGGVPTIATTTVDGDWDLDTSFPLGSVVQQFGECHILNNPWWVTDGMTNLVERSDARAMIFRDENVGGLILSTTADRRVAVTAGKLWARLNEFAITAVATNSTFEVYWRTSSTLWATADVTTLSTVKYNNITTNALTTIDNNKYVNWWAYAEADDDAVAFVYPQAQYNSAAEAEAVGAPSTIPDHLSKHAILIGRVIMQQGTTAPIETQSAFSTVFAASAAADHGNLTGLTDDDHTQYLLTSGTRSQGTINVATSATIAFLTATTANITNLTVGTVTITAMDTVTVGSITVTTDATITALRGGLTTIGTLLCTTLDTINVASIGTLFVNTSGSFALLTCGNLSVKTAATIASGTVTNLYAGPSTIGNLIVTTGGIIGLATAGNLTVTTAATILSLAAPTFRSTTSTITTLIGASITATTISYGTSINYPTLVRAVEIENPGGAENITLFRVASAATITDMYAVVRGTSPSVTWVVKHGTDRSAGGASVNTAGTTTTDTTSGSTVTAFTDATIVANSWVWLVTTATSGTINSLNVTINYRMDA